MNKASLRKFSDRVKSGGLIVFNSSQIDQSPQPAEQVEVLSVPADELAVELGSQKIANMVALGAYLQKRGLFTAEDAAACLKQTLASRYFSMIELNGKALRRGASFAEEAAQT
jgi:2-oxoglutarate ferredoxin oxidoreductase subunit gamma